MKMMFTRVTAFALFLLSFCQVLTAQINVDSPFPVDFQILTPPAIAGSYSYGTQAGGWGPTLNKTVSAPVAWGYTAAKDSLGCSAITTDLKGKIAMIRRGTCDFSTKVYNAQQAGAIGVIVANHFSTATDNDNVVYNMTAGANAASVKVPAIFISRAVSKLIADQLKNKVEVNASFTVLSFTSPTGAYTFETPQSHVIPLEAFEVDYSNNDSTKALTMTVSGEITDPQGKKTALTPVTKTIAALSDSTFTFLNKFTPTVKGTYVVTYNNNQNAEIARAPFIVGDLTFATDDLEILGGIGPQDASFTAAGRKLQFGSIVPVGQNGGVATHASFGLSNTDDLFVSGNPDANAVTIILYDADKNDDGNLDFSNSGGSFDDLNPVAFATYTMTGKEDPEALITVKLESIDSDVVKLKPNGTYYITVLYDGTLANTGKVPFFFATRQVSYVTPSTLLELDRLYSGFSDFTLVSRLHLDGFATGVKVALSPAKVAVMPNPGSEFVRLQLQLEQRAEEVRIGVLDFNGRLLRSQVLKQVQNQNVDFDVRDLPAGTYFFSITTPEGYRAEKFVVVR